MRQRIFISLAFLIATGCPGPVDPDDGGTDTDGGLDGSTVQCTRHSDCGDQELFCTRWRCEPGTAGADARGCIDLGPPCEAGQECDEDADACGRPTWCTEGKEGCLAPGDCDGDGSRHIECDGDDCDDDDPNRKPGNLEVCDAEGHDEDCNLETFAGADDGDLDGDGFISATCCNGERCGDDCDDSNPNVHPGATEVCDGNDTNCDGVVDGTVGGPGPVGATTFYEDLDGDGYGNPEVTAEACSPPEGWVTNDRDCYDGSADVNPSQTGFFTQPVCRNGATPAMGPPLLCPPGEEDCWTCGDRAAEPRDYDYDCSGAAEPQAAVACFVVPPSCRGGRGPENDELPAKCGLPVDFVDCRSNEYGGCAVQRNEARLGCR